MKNWEPRRTLDISELFRNYLILPTYKENNTDFTKFILFSVPNKTPFSLFASFEIKLYIYFNSCKKYYKKTVVLQIML